MFTRVRGYVYNQCPKVIASNFGARASPVFRNELQIEVLPLSMWPKTPRFTFRALRLEFRVCIEI
jgi:hypothetical protein